MGEHMFPGNSTLWNRIVAKAWTDDAFKKRLLADPVEVMREEGLELNREIRVSVVENTPGHIWLVLPRQPEAEPSVIEDGLRVASQGLGFIRALRAM